MRHFEQSLTSSSQFTDQRSNQEKYVVEGETPRLAFEMGRILVKLFLVTQVCFPVEMSAHFRGFSPKN